MHRASTQRFYNNTKKLISIIFIKLVIAIDILMRIDKRHYKYPSVENSNYEY